MKELIKKRICEFVVEYRKQDNIQTRWQDPIIGIGSAHDPLFDELKTAVNETHAVPVDIMEDAASVVAFFLPFEKFRTPELGDLDLIPIRISA